MTGSGRRRLAGSAAGIAASTAGPAAAEADPGRVSSFLEWRMMSDLVATDDMRAAFDERRMVDQWVRCWVAMAAAQAEHGVIPRASAEGIAAALDGFRIDPAEIAAETRLVGRGIAPALHRVRARVGAQLAGHVHVGGTTQDILDTGLALQMQEGLALVERDARIVMTRLVAMAREHRNTVMAGRTNMLQAAPITFGFKVAGWIAQFTRAVERLRQASGRALAVQLGGPVGTFDTMGPQGIEVRATMAHRLGLGVHPTGWATQRDGIAECLFALGLLVSALGHVAIETGTLVRTEIDELREGGGPGRGASTAMPQKSNPRSTEFLEGLSRIVQSRAAGLYGMLWQPNERHGGVWIAEWPMVPEHFLLASGALLHADELIGGLFVNAAQMRANMDLDGGAVMSEAFSAALVPALGRTAAYDRVKAAVETARRERRPLAEVIAAMPEIRDRVSPQQLAGLLDPRRHVGLAPEMVEAACLRAEVLWA